jgi:GNAT superfamily N-acetyltransferase
MAALTIRDLDVSDHDEWVRLYRGYRDFYDLTPDPDAIETTWTWVSSHQHGMRGLVAVDESGALVALANLRTFARPSMGRMGLYLDDLFTSSAARGLGAGTALLARAAEIAAQDGAIVVRWITSASNATARRLYDEHATATQYVTYDMPPAPPLVE